MYVVGTAGHVDHGKSTLVRALTGIDPDRLREEKERGMTIDLGFAWLKLPSGEEISIVDVPGHERFIKNMLAGVGGIDVAMIVVAADEGVMPQTVEHVAILELLHIRRAVVALTKVDAVEADWLDLVESDVADYLGRTAFAGAPIMRVSALTGEGLPELNAALDAALADTPPKPDVGRPRVPVDRAFTVAGFGTIVTGTLIGGGLAVGQEIEIVPAGLRTRARGLQMHKAKVDRAVPGSRVAVNLVGVSTEEVGRGQVLTTPGWLRPSSAADVSIAVLHQAPHPLLHGSTLTFHAGSAEVEARVLLFESQALAPGERGWGQLRFGEPAAVVKGDLFVLRTPNATIAGGEVVDAQARRHRRRDAGLIETLRVLQEGSPEQALLAELRARGPAEPAALAERTGLGLADTRRLADELVAAGEVVRLGDQLVDVGRWQRLTEDTDRALAEYHRAHPLRTGMSREELRSRVGATARLYMHALARLAADGALVDRDGLVRRSDHEVVLSAAQEERARRMLALLGATPFTPPSISELPPDSRPDAELLHALADRGRVILVDDDLAFTPEAYAHMREKIVGLLREKGKATVADVRDLLGSSRKFALALLEYFDQQRLTRRVGDDRVLY